MKKIENSKNRNEIIVNLNKLKKIGKPFKTKNIEHKRIDYKNGTYNNINAESKSSMKNMKILNMNTIEFDNFKFKKVSPINNKNETRKIYFKLLSSTNSFYKLPMLINNKKKERNESKKFKLSLPKKNEINISHLIKAKKIQQIQIKLKKKEIIKKFILNYYHPQIHFINYQC